MTSREQRMHNVWEARRIACPVCSHESTWWTDRIEEDPSVGINVGYTIAYCPVCHVDYTYADNGLIADDEDVVIAEWVPKTGFVYYAAPDELENRRL